MLKFVCLQKDGTFGKALTAAEALELDKVAFGEMLWEMQALAALAEQDAARTAGQLAFGDVPIDADVAPGFAPPHNKQWTEAE